MKKAWRQTRGKIDIDIEEQTCRASKKKSPLCEWMVVFFFSLHA